VRHQKPLSFRAEESLFAAVEAEAKRLGTTTSAVCRELVERGLAQRSLEQRLRDLERSMTERLREAALLVLLNLGKDLQRTDPRELQALVEGSVRPGR
jgi:hypothetical protein